MIGVLSTVIFFLGFLIYLVFIRLHTIAECSISLNYKRVKIIISLPYHLPVNDYVYLLKYQH